ncbi:F-box protein At3g57590-like [Rhododendron vialii]|uniref:F-box protein At3g57590-like n=1 Tax=Rhododendron vialii TaxID=182163 RepID=UPI00265E544C|nr:F-box protein At3g57590-like [Rhododendron vialii]
MCYKKGTLQFSSGNTCGITNEGFLPILTRLPAKMVGQCKCICKHWRALIEEPSFVELHHFRAKSRPGGCYLVISSCTPNFKDTIFFSADYEGGLAQHLFSYPASGFYSCQACVNGLICFWFNEPKSIVIVNPITKELISLTPFNPPWSNTSRYGNISMPLVSFGFDPSAKQYKVVNIYKVRENSTHGEVLSYCECEIFTLGSLSWRKIDIVPLASRFEFGSDGICLGGVIYIGKTFIGNLLLLRRRF